MIGLHRQLFLATPTKTMLWRRSQWQWLCEFARWLSVWNIYIYTRTQKEMYMSPIVSTFHKEIYSYLFCCIEENNLKVAWSFERGHGQWARPQHPHNETEVPMMNAWKHIIYLHALVGGGTCGQCKPSCLWGLLIRVAPFKYQEQPYIYMYIYTIHIYIYIYI